MPVIPLTDVKVLSKLFAEFVIEFSSDPIEDVPVDNAV